MDIANDVVADSGVLRSCLLIGPMGGNGATDATVTTVIHAMEDNDAREDNDTY